jgi:homoserine O-acetyltransferase
LRDSDAPDYATLFEKCRHQRYTIFTIDDDYCFYPEEQAYYRNKLEEGLVPVNYVTVHSDKGHDSFLLEPHLYEKELRAALNN